jgi:hypothetical protein
MRQSVHKQGKKDARDIPSKQKKTEERKKSASKKKVVKKASSKAKKRYVLHSDFVVRDLFSNCFTHIQCFFLAYHRAPMMDISNKNEPHHHCSDDDESSDEEEWNWDPAEE